MHLCNLLLLFFIKACKDLIMLSAIGKIIERFANQKFRLYIGWIIKTKADVTTALNLGTFAVSTAKQEL